MPINGFNEKDYQIFSEIENIRKYWLSGSEKREFYDYGAISPEAMVTPEEMYRGRRVTRSMGELCGQGLKGKWAHLLYGLVKAHRPANILELGTCCGFSAIYMAKASPDATIYTIEGAEEVAGIAKSNFHKAECRNIIQTVGRFQDVLVGVLHRMQRVDFAFIDGHHNKDATIRYYSEIKPFLNKNAILVFDDISWSQGMGEAWQTIKNDKDVKHYEDLQKLGICYMERQGCGVRSE